MSPIKLRTQSRWRSAVALLLVLALLLWLALPRLLGVAAERWLTVPGLDIVLVDIESLDARHAQLREVRAVYHSGGGHRINIAVHDIAVDYSLQRQHIDRLEIARGELEIVAAQDSPATPWPQLAWPSLPLSEAQVGDLRASVRWPERAPLEAQGEFSLRQTEGQWQAEFRPDAGLLRISANESLEIHAEWLPAKGPAADARLSVGRDPAQQAARLSAQLPLSLLPELGRALGLALPLNAQRGTLALRAEAQLGELAGSVNALSGEAEFIDASLHAPGPSLDIELAGRLRFAWQAAGARLELGLQPGVHWQLKADRMPALQASGRLQREFVLRLADGVALSAGEFPLTLAAPGWGRWDGVLQQLRLNQETASADAQLRIKGQLPRWQRDAVQIGPLQASGDAALHWSRAGGLRSELALQIAIDRLSWQGDSPLWASKTNWTLVADAAADGDFWPSLSLNVEASSPQLKLEQASGPLLTLGASRLQVQRFRPARSAGELSLAIDAIRIGRWPAPDLRARLQLEGDALRANGSVLLQGTEVLHFSASQAIAGQCGNASLSAQPSLPALGKLLQPRPAALLPLEFQAGDAEASLALSWCAQPTLRVDAKGGLQLRHTALAWDRARIEGLQGRLQLDGLHPLQGRIQLAAQGGELATGTALAELQLDLALSAQELSVNALRASLLGGSLRSGPLSLPWPAAGHALPLEVEQLDLGQLLALFKLQGLSGSGRLNGVLPLVYADGGVEISDGQLNSDGAGTLKYAPALSIPDNPGLLALRNFHFEQLGVRAWYASNGAYRTQATLEGSNPELYNGYPVRFKLNINGELPGLFRAALFSGDFDRHILEQLQSGKLE